MIRVAETDEDIDACYLVMAELRPTLKREEFVDLVQRLKNRNGFHLVQLETDGRIVAIAGYRISEWLAGGRYLEIEDLVSAHGERSKGYGGQLFDWLVDVAKANHCDHLRLVSALSRTGAHRFYEQKGMTREAYYFSMKIDR